MDSSKKVTDCKKILSSITEPSSTKAEEKKGKALPFASSKSLSLGLGVRASFASQSHAARLPANLTVAQKLDFSDDSTLLNSTCSSPATGSKRRSDQDQLLVDGELTFAQGKITSLTNELEVERTSKKRLKIEQEKTIRDYQAEKIVLEARNKDLMDKLRRLEKTTKDAEDNASSVLATSLSEKAAHEMEKYELEALVEQQKTDLQEMRSNLEHANGDIDRLNESSEMAKDEACLQVEEYERAAENDRARIYHLQKEVDELRDCRRTAAEAENQILDLNNQIRLLEEEAQLGKLFKEQSEEIRQLQLANDELCERNRILSTTQEDTSVLQEKLRSATAKIKRTEDRLQDMTRLNLEITKLRTAVTEWENVLGEVLPDVVSTPNQKSTTTGTNRLTTDALRQYLAKSQRDLLYASEQRQKTELELGAAHDVENQLRNELGSARADHQKEQQKVRQQQELLIKLRKKYQLVTKERDSYRSVLNSYESEMTVNPADVNRKQLEDLEEVLASYRREVDREFLDVPNLGKVLPTLKTETQPEVATADAKTSEIPDAGTSQDVQAGKVELPMTVEDVEKGVSEDAAAAVILNEETQKQQEIAAREREIELKRELGELEDKLNRLQSENTRISEVNEMLQSENSKLNDILEGQRMKGDYDPTDTKVVHMRFNPFEMMKQKKMEELGELKVENEKLAARLRSLEAGEGGSAAGSDSSTRISSSKELEELRSKVSASELKNKRLVEAFQKTSKDLREAVFRLFGYQLDIPMSKKYKLMSMYADSPGDFLLFSQSGNGEMQLLETEFSTTLTDLIDAYLSDADSIPAFLASVTMDLFNKQTIA